MKVFHLRIIITLGICFIAFSLEVRAQANTLKLAFQQEGKPLIVENVSFDIIDSKNNLVLHEFIVSKNVVSIPSDISFPTSFDVRVVFDEKELILQDLNRKFLGGDWKIGFRDYHSRSKKCKDLLRIFRIDFHLTGKEGIYWLTSRCLPPEKHRS